MDNQGKCFKNFPLEEDFGFCHIIVLFTKKYIITVLLFWSSDF
jgi:hypothetical protein